MEILKVFALLMLSYGLVSSETTTITADPDASTPAPTDSPTSAPTNAPPSQGTNAPGSTGGDGGNNPTTKQAPAATTPDPFVPGRAALTALSSNCTAKTENDDCNAEKGLVDTASTGTNHTALCSTFKTYFDCTQSKCNANTGFQAATLLARNFLSTHCNSAVLTQGSMALAITLAWLSAYISGKL